MREVLTAEIDGLVATAGKLSQDASLSQNSLGPDRIEELLTVAARGGQIVRQLYPPKSNYESIMERILQTHSFAIMHSNHFRHVSELVGVLKGVQGDVKSGLLRDLRRLLEAEIFADLLEMADHLLGEGYKDAAAVLLGAVLEDSLRKIATGNGVPTTAPNGRPLTIDPLNAAIVKTGTYNALVQQQITTWAKLRNDAAHGHFANYDAAQVRQMLMFVQKFCSDHLH